MPTAVSPGKELGPLHPYLFWGILALPVIAIVFWGRIFGGNPGYLRHTGLMGCWLLIAALAVTPLGMMFGPTVWVRWLRANRRYLGVASFGYTLLHLAVFMVKTNLTRFIATFTRYEILLGWLGFAVMLAMAITSNDRSVRTLGLNWKRLQRWVYLGAALVLAHWVLSEKNYREVAIYTAPLIFLMIWRLLRRRTTA